MLEPGESRAECAWLLSANAMGVGAVETVFGEALATGALETIFGEALGTGAVETIFGEALATGAVETIFGEALATGAVETIFSEALTACAVKAVLGIAGGLSRRRCEGMRMGAIESIFGGCACGKCEKGEGQDEFAFHGDAPE